MTPMLIAAVAVVLIASAATIAVGAAYKWQVTDRGYGIWTRAIGVSAIVALTAVTAWSRRDEAAVLWLVIIGGVALAAGYLWLHLKLTRTLREAGVESTL